MRGLRPRDADSELVGRSLQGDAEAFDEFVERHKRRILRLAYRMTRDVEEAEDIVDDVFLEVHHSLPRFRREATFATWLYRLATNVCLEHLRRRKAGSRLLETLLETSQPPFVPDPAEAAEEKDLAEHVRQAVERLPEAQRIPVTMFYLEGCTYAEVAAQLGITAKAVRARVSRALKALRASLKTDGFGPC